MAYGPPPCRHATIEAVNGQERFVRIGGALIWIFAAFPVSMELHTPRTRIAVRAVSYVTFGVALFFATRPRGRRILPMAVEVAAVVGMGVAEGTIKNHVSNILAKLAARDRTRAVLKALEAGLL